MSNINVFRPVVLEKKIFYGFCCINLFKNISPLGVAICDPRDFIWTYFNFLVLGMFYVKYCPIWCNSSWEVHFFKHFPVYHLLLLWELSPLKYNKRPSGPVPLTWFLSLISSEGRLYMYFLKGLILKNTISKLIVPKLRLNKNQMDRTKVL